MPKAGHPLRTIPAFEPSLLGRLRDELSVTTAEELVGLWKVAPGALSKLLGGDERARELFEAASSAIPSEEMAAIDRAQKSSYPFRTGHQPPPGGKETY